jgi:hypothetical protein
MIQSERAFQMDLLGIMMELRSSLRVVALNKLNLLINLQPMVHVHPRPEKRQI